jgi:Mlc titration factor MtfA (ptsG expression regulator)
MFWLLKERHRARRRLASPPAEWQQILQKNFALFPRLSPDDQRELLGHMQVFIAEKNFEGCAGLQMTDEIRVTIAAQACLLLLHRQTDYYPKLRSILVYPRAYLAESEERSGPLVHQYATERAGESWQIGAVVLAWDEVLDGASDPVDGYNVVFHEFAHQLDQEDGAHEGVPVLERRSHYVAWARVLGREFRRLQRQVLKGEETFLDMYGATDPAEFFAVATEFFFESPHQLKKKHLALYEQLRQFYRQDPVRFVQAPAGDT